MVRHDPNYEEKPPVTLEGIASVLAVVPALIGQASQKERQDALSDALRMLSRACVMAGAKKCPPSETSAAPVESSDYVRGYNRAITDAHNVMADEFGHASRDPNGTARTDEDARSRAILAHARLVQNEPSAAQAILESILWGAAMPDAEWLKALADGDHARSSLHGEHVALGRRLAEARDAALEEAANTAEAVIDERDSCYVRARSETIAFRIRALKSKPAPKWEPDSPTDLPDEQQAPREPPPEKLRELFEHREAREEAARRLDALATSDAHDFGWALAQMRAGKKVRRRVFIPGAHYRWDGGCVLSHTSTPQDLMPWNDLTATDWEVAE